MNGPPRSLDAPIGIFDSGLGGLTVASAMARALPAESLIYLGDTARVPYGTRSSATVVKYARRNIAFLQESGVKAVVIACNTVSAQGVESLGPLDIPVLGVVEPGAATAFVATRGGAVAILGTRATVESSAYPRALATLGYSGTVIPIACPLFVPLAEEGWDDHQVTREVARTYLKPLAGRGVDTVILGCTHYPLLRAAIAEVVEEICGPGIVIVDSAQAVAGAIHQVLEDEGLLAHGSAPSLEFFVTDAPSGVASAGARFWGEMGHSPPVFQHVDITFDTP